MPPTICIVGGCGHVGLPLGVNFAQVGAQVSLLDTDAKRVELVSGGSMPFMERGLDAAALQAVLASGRLRATTDYSGVGASDVVIVTIGTPVNEYLDPDIDSFDRTLDALLNDVRDGQLLILRSTVFPGLTERLARRIAARGLHLDLAHCPERVAQGFALEEQRALPQLIGGVTEAAAQRAAELFALLGPKVIQLSPIEAELAKLFSNAFRYINFAISNQFYLIARSFDADFHRIHKAMTADYPRLAGFAGAGFAGGPCLLKDTMQLAAFNHNGFVIGQAAMMVNEGLPSALVEHVKKGRDLTHATAAILGMAFKGNSDDPRASLAYKLRKLLSVECARVLCTDPYIHNPGFVSLETAVQEADVIFIGACHDEYRNLSTDKPVVDVFNFVRPKDGVSIVSMPEKGLCA